MIAEDSVETHAQGRTEDVLELEVPRERHPVEAMEERDEAAVPVGSPEVDGIDPRCREARRPAFGSLGDPLESSGVDESDVVVATAEVLDDLDPVTSPPTVTTG